jgi:acetyl esterase/lipase
MQRVELCSEAFSSRAWLRQCNSTLVCASAAIDELCTAIVNTKKVFDDQLIVGDLALTVAALERSVYDYAKRIRVQNKKPSDELDKEKDEGKLLWKHPGAVMSLLDLLTDCMEQLGKVLNGLQQQHSLVGFLSVHKKVILNSSAAFGLLMMFLKRKAFFTKASSLSRGIQFTPFLVKSCVILLAARLAHKISLYRKFKKLKHLHAQFSTLMRFWQICMSEISSNLDSEDTSTTPKTPRRYIPIPISKWMLDLAGVGTMWYDCMYDMNRDLWFLWYTYSILYSSVKLWYSIGGNSMRWYGFPFAFLASFYYALRPRLAASSASELLSSLYLEKERRNSNGNSMSRSRNVRLSHIKAAWSSYDSRICDWKRKWSWIWSHLVSYRFAKRIRSKFSWWPFRWMAFYSVSVLGFSPKRISLKFSSSSENLKDCSFTQYISLYGSKSLKKARAERLNTDFNPVLMFIHGGGWVANFLNSDMSFLSEWAHVSDIPIVLFDYSLNSGDSFSYSDALQQSMLAYDSVCNGDLGFLPTKVILAGDSVGARIAISLCAELISQKKKIPDSLVLAYPPLNLSQISSPSRAIFMMDPIVPMSILHPHESKLPSDSTFPNSLDISDSTLTQFPSTSIIVGSIDPFLDDSVDFAHRLSSCGVSCRFDVSRGLPHGFLCFGTMLPRVSESVTRVAHQLIGSVACVARSFVEHK